jgi:excisionase family DNA binding protein
MSEQAAYSVKLAYRIDEAVKASGLGRSFLYEQIAGGALKSFKVGGRRLIARADLEAFLDKARGMAGTHPVRVDIKKAKLEKRANVLPGQMEFPWSAS